MCIARGFIDSYNHFRKGPSELSTCIACVSLFCFQQVHHVSTNALFIDVPILKQEMFFVDKIVGLDNVWLLGDNFVASTYRKYFLQRLELIEEEVRKEELFIKSNYDFDLYCNSRYNSPTQNMLVRLQNTFARALNGNIALPRYMIVILDDDLIDFLTFKQAGISQILGEWLIWLIKELDTVINSMKTKLPAKSKRETEPCLLVPITYSLQLQ